MIPMSIKEIASAVEAILFAAGYPVEVIKLMEATGADQDDFEDAIGLLNQKYDTESGVRLVFLDQFLPEEY